MTDWIIDPSPLMGTGTGSSGNGCGDRRMTSGPIGPEFGATMAAGTATAAATLGCEADTATAGAAGARAERDATVAILASTTGPCGAIGTLGELATRGVEPVGTSVGSAGAIETTGAGTVVVDVDGMLEGGGAAATVVGGADGGEVVGGEMVVGGPGCDGDDGDGAPGGPGGVGGPFPLPGASAQTSWPVHHWRNWHTPGGGVW